MQTIYYRIGQRATLYAFTPLVDDSGTDLAEQAAGDYWKRTGIANNHRPIIITLLNEQGQIYGNFRVIVRQPPIYQATPEKLIQHS